MALSLLGICAAACGRMSLEAPTTVIGNISSKLPVMLLALARLGAQDLSRRAAWKALTREQTFSTTADEAQTGALPSDLDWIIPETMFNRSLNRPVDGPLSPQEWQAIKSSQTTAVYPCYRIRGTSLLMNPAPTSTSQTVAYEYITANWCTAADGTTEQSDWEGDSDIPVLKSELHVLSLIYRFKEAQGLSFESELQTFERALSYEQMREGTRPRISTDGPARFRNRGQVIAGQSPNVILTENQDAILWE